MSFWQNYAVLNTVRGIIFSKDQNMNTWGSNHKIFKLIPINQLQKKLLPLVPWDPKYYRIQTSKFSLEGSFYNEPLYSKIHEN
jgi:hypothetical protein